MEKSQYTLAHINLFAVLRGITHLVKLDKEVQNMISDIDISIKFSIRKGPKGVLVFKDGKCELLEGNHKHNVNLYFNSPSHFNKMISGEANPIPLKGISKLGFLTKDFKLITDKLEYYMKPTKELLEDKEYYRINTIMTFYTAFNALSQIANTDKVGKYTAKRIKDGIVQVSIGDDIHAHIKSMNGRLTPVNGKPEKYQALMRFADIETANGVLNGNLDSYSAIGNKKLKLTGFIPMLDNMNNLLYQTSMYLKEEV